MTTPVEDLLAERLAAAGHGDRWQPPAADAPIVNGLRVPLVRLPGADLMPFFEAVQREANGRFFAGRLPTCAIGWNRRFRRLGGRIDLKSLRIELSAVHYESAGAAALGVVVVHEQIHLDLHVRGRDSGHTREFQRISTSLGLPSIYHEMILPPRARRHVMHQYRCGGCRTVVASKVKFRTPRACRECCDRLAGGKFDRRFRLIYLRTVRGEAAGDVG